MSNLGPLAGGRAQGVPTPPRGDTIARYATYLEAQRAVDYLSDNAFPVQAVTIVGTGLRMVERVTGRLDVLHRRAAQPALGRLLRGHGGPHPLAVHDGGRQRDPRRRPVRRRLQRDLRADRLLADRRPPRLLLRQPGRGHRVRGALPARADGAGPRAPRAAAQPGRPGADPRSAPTRATRRAQPPPPPYGTSPGPYGPPPTYPPTYPPAGGQQPPAYSPEQRTERAAAGPGQPGPGELPAQPPVTRADLRRDDREAAPGAPRARGRRAQGGAARAAARRPRASESRQDG